MIFPWFFSIISPGYLLRVSQKMVLIFLIPWACLIDFPKEPLEIFLEGYKKKRKQKISVRIWIWVCRRRSGEISEKKSEKLLTENVWITECIDESLKELMQLYL